LKGFGAKRGALGREGCKGREGEGWRMVNDRTE